MARGTRSKEEKGAEQKASRTPPDVHWRFEKHVRIVKRLKKVMGSFTLPIAIFAQSDIMYLGGKGTSLKKN